MNRSKAKGTAAEKAVCDYLRDFFPHVERRALAGSGDRGDVAGIPGVCLEVKNTKTMDLAGWLKEAEKEAANDGAEIYAAIAKKRGTTNVAEWYAIMPVDVLVALLQVWSQ